MWDIFLAFLLLGSGLILAFYELRRWIVTKRWVHLAVIIAVVISEAALVKGFLEASVILVCTVVLAFVVEGRKGA